MVVGPCRDGLSICISRVTAHCAIALGATGRAALALRKLCENACSVPKQKIIMPLWHWSQCSFADLLCRGVHCAMVTVRIHHSARSRGGRVGIRRFILNARQHQRGHFRSRRRSGGTRTASPRSFQQIDRARFARGREGEAALQANQPGSARGGGRNRTRTAESRTQTSSSASSICGAAATPLETRERA